MKKTLFLLSMFSLVILAGCTAKQQPVEIGNQADDDTFIKPAVKTVKIGVIAPLSGSSVSYGKDVVEVVTRFGEVFNSTYSDVQLEWIIEDGGCNTQDATSAVEKLINGDKVAVIVGGVCSSETLAAGKIAQKEKVLMIAPGSASSAISSLGDWVVRTDNNILVAETLSTVIGETFTSITIIAEEQDESQDIADRFSEQVEVKVNRIDFSSHEDNFVALAKQVTQSDDDVLFIFTESDVTSIPLVKSLDEAGYGNTIHGARTLLTPTFLETFGTTVDGFLEVRAQIPIDPLVLASEYAQSIEGYEPLGNEFVFLQAADAMRMIILAVESGATLPEHFKQFVYYFDETDPYVGYTGRYWFDEKGDAVGIDYTMYEARNGHLFPLY